MSEKRPKQRTTTKGRLTDSHEDIHRQASVHVQPVATTTVKSSEQPHIGSYTFTRSSFTVALRASAPSLLSVPSSLWSTLCLRCPCFVAMLIDSRSCVRTCRGVLSDCPKILTVSVRDTTAQTTKRHDNNTTTTTSAMTMMKGYSFWTTRTTFSKDDPS